jgi:uncharacterized membrane protein
MNEGTKLWEEKRRQKLALARAREKDRRKIYAVVAVAIVVVLVGVGAYYAYDGWASGGATLKKYSSTVETVNLTTIAIPTSTIGQTATFYTYGVGGVDIRFFAVKDGNGTVRTAFDECPLCYSRHLGYRQEGDVMMENCCEMSWPIDMIGPNCTGCHPAYLPSRIEGDRVLISKSDLGAGAYMFK